VEKIQVGDTGELLSRKFNIAPSSSTQTYTHQYAATPRMTIDHAERQAREDRKRGMVQQPRTAGGRAQMGAPKSRPRTASEIVRDTKRARGFPTNE
jgi:hypothetical protein